jgi:hypothetical protein
MRAKDIMESLHKSPVTEEQLGELLVLMDKPILAKNAQETIGFCLKDDDLTSKINVSNLSNLTSTRSNLLIICR